MMAKTSALVLLSGGLDSTTAFYKALWEKDDVTAISFDYGQRHRKELESSLDFAEMHGVPWSSINLQSLGELLKGSSLSDLNVPVPEGHYAKETMKSTIVPNRNSIMLSCAVGVAVANKIQEVWAAMHAGDHAIYPDCRPEFISSLNATIRFANAWEDPIPQVVTPFIGYTKDMIVQLGADMGVPYERTWSCYEGGEIHCGRCGTCVERQEAFALARVDDPTAYTDSEFWKQETGRVP
jgi:7-cyano-7-deazaguanine synthase